MIVKIPNCFILLSYKYTYFSFLIMKSVNKVILLGNVTRDPELKSTNGGQSVCTFGLATNRVWKDQNGAKQSLAEYHNLVCWGGLAEFVAQNVRKGKPLYAEGYLKTRNWDSPDGAKIFRTEIVVDNVVLLGARENGHHGDSMDTGEHFAVPADAGMTEPLEASAESMVIDSLDADFHLP